MTRLLTLIISCGLLASSFAATVTVNPDLNVKSLDRTIDMTTQLVKMSHKVTLENKGKSPAKTFLFSIDPSLRSKVAHIGATVGSSEKTYLRLYEAKVTSEPEKSFWEIELKAPLGSGASTTLSVEVVLGSALEMYPAAISQKEKQLVRFSGNLYAFLPYPVTTQSTTVLLASSNLESYTKTKPVSLQDTSITYGPYRDRAPFSVGELIVHGENNSPMLVVTNLVRVIELSMWGNIAVEETVDVAHKGASLKGSFSRYEFQRENSGVSSVKNFKTLLPASAKNVYYRDDIGNISTSHMKVMDDAVELDLRPRFPLFGGWKTHYVVGYNVPSYEYLFYSGARHVLNMRLLDHVYDDMLVSGLEVRVILPEGVSDVKLATPYPVARGEDSKHFTYLDVSGRTVVSLFSKPGQLLTESHIQDFQVEFNYPHTSMIFEPLLLVLAFLLLYLVAIVYVRLDFSITVDQGEEAKMKVAGYCEKVASLQDRRAGLYHALEEAILKLKANKDIQAFQNTTKRIGGDQKAETAAISEISQTIRSVSAELGDKVEHLQRMDKQFRDYQAQQTSLVEKLVSGKMAKQQFIEQETNIVRKKTDTLDKINQIIKSF